MLVENKYLRSKKHSKKSWNGVPATVRQSLFETKLYESFFASIVWHIIGLMLISLIIFSCNFFGITPKLFPKPKKPMQDIEFIIKNQSGHHSRHSRKISESSGAEVKNNEIKNTVKDNITPTKKDINASNKPKESKKQINKKTSGSKSVVSNFSIPMPNLKSISSGLGNSRGSRNHHAGAESSNASLSGIDSAFSSGGGLSAGSGGGSSGRAGFDKNAAKKIITTYDISPYVSELKRNIQWNWKAPKAYGNKKVELFLRIAKDGKIIILNVKKTSEVGEVDNSALNAVKKCLPLNPLPSKYSKSYLDVIFVFDSSTSSLKSRY